MKVLHVYKTYFPDPPGGLQEAIRQICKCSKINGIETRIFTLSPNPEPKNVEIDGVKVTRSKAIFQMASCDIGFIDSLFEYRRLADWADIIHFHYPWPFLDILKLVTPKCKKMVITYHSDIVRQKTLELFYSPLRFLTFRNIDKIICTSDNYLKSSDYLNSSEVIRNKCSVIQLSLAEPNMVLSDNDEAHILNKFGLVSSQYVLSVGVLRYYKGFDFLLDAAKDVNIKIAIAGSGPEESKLKDRLINENILNVSLLGQVTEKEKYVLFKNATLFVLPSHLRSEAFGVVLMEALMHAKPIISCNINTGTSYVNLDGLTGLVVPPGQGSKLSEAINRIIEDAGWQTIMQRNARERYKKVFSTEAVSRLYKSEYDNLMID